MSWVAVDKSGTICEFSEKPVRNEETGQWVCDGGVTVHPPIKKGEYPNMSVRWMSNEKYLIKQFRIFSKLTWDEEPIAV